MGMIGIILGNIKNMRQAKKLRALGRDGLLALDDDALYDAAACMSRDGVMEIDDPGLPEQLVNIYALTQFEAEVNNGGLCQFFVNSSRVVAPYVSDYMALIGASEHKALFDGFISQHRIDLNDLSSFIIHRHRDYEAQTKRYPFDEYDDAFYALPSLEEPLTAYIKANLSHF